MASERLEDEAHPGDYCPIAATMDLLNGKWTLHILRALLDGKKRFNEISRAIGPVSSRTLCCRLRALEEQGILVREIKNTIPPWVEYELTEKGRALNEVLDSIARWGLRYMQAEVEACRSEAQEAAKRRRPAAETARLLPSLAASPESHSPADLACCSDPPVSRRSDS